MNNMGLWLFMAFKRQLKRPFFLLVLLIIPVFMGLFKNLERQDSGRIEIALYTDGDAWNDLVADKLMDGSHSFDFYLCGSRKELERDVASKRAECGFVLPAGLKDMLDQGDYRRKIGMVVSPSTVTAKLASETVFAGLFEIYGRDLLKTYVETSKVFDSFAGGRDALWQELGPLYDKYLKNGSTFQFEYSTLSRGMIKESTVKAVFPVRGIAAVFVLVIGLSAAVTASLDKKRGFFQAMASHQEAAFILVQMAAPVFLACVSAYLCLAAGGELGEPFLEAALLFVYGIAVTVFCCILGRLIKNPLLLSGLIPFFIIGSLIACPVFADLSVFVPVLKTVRLFFLPYYYLIL